MKKRARPPSEPPAQASPIVRAGRPVLRATAAPVDPERIGTPEIQSLIAAMVRAMRAAPGVGLAAPQIGVGLQIIVLEDRDELMSRLSPAQREERGRTPFPLTAIVNPSLRVLPGARATFFEGCLSVPGYMALVERDLAVEVTGLDAAGQPLRWEARGWPARILQHEVDHLRGALYVDRMISRSFAANEEVAERWLDLPVDAILRELGVAPAGEG